MIELENVTLGYNSEIILEHVNLKIAHGEKILFTGSNGAGKTTLLRGILGLIKPFAGKIKTSFEKKPPAYVPQFSTIDSINPITVRDVILMGVNLTGLKYDTGFIESFGLAPCMEKSYRTLSGGMKQRALFLRALLIRSDALLLDEATSQLDRESENFILDYILNSKETILLVSHHYDLHGEKYSKFKKYRVKDKNVIEVN